METTTVSGYYGSGHTACNVICAAARGGTWYAVEGSQNVNFVYDVLEDGVNVEKLQDSDMFTWPDGIYSEEDLEGAITT